jgi:two-component system, cell cycle response regulator
MEYTSTILIIDDEKSARETLEALLTKENYLMHFASNGTEGLEMAVDLNPDVILLDVMMPGLNGFEVCIRLRSNPMLAEVPIILVTALDDRDSHLHGIASGADDFVTKPFDRLELRARIRNITRLNRYRRLVSERSKFEWVVEQTSEGYIMLDKEDRIIYANPQARIYLGLSDDASPPFQGTFFSRARKEYGLEPAELWDEWPGFAGEEHKRYLVRPETENARALWLQVESLVLPTGSGSEHLVRLRDITAEITLQIEMHSFTQMVHHKLRTPLTSLYGGVQFLAEESPNLSKDEVSEMAKIAFEGIDNLRQEVEEILQYINVGRMPALGAGFSLADTKSMIDYLGKELNLSNLQMAVHGSVSKFSVKLMPQAMELILRELLQNAKKFHPEHNPNVEVMIEPTDDGFVRFTMRDDGSNLSPAQLRNVWKPYYQADKNQSGRIPGMGLGLSMVASLVWGVGGTCKLYNRDGGNGVVVDLKVPLESVEEKKPSRRKTKALI